MTVSGADVVYKDIVEPLETVSVTLLETDKKDVAEYGPVEEVSSVKGGMQEYRMEMIWEVTRWR